MCWDSGDLWGNVLPNGRTFPLQPQHILVVLNFKSQWIIMVLSRFFSQKWLEFMDCFCLMVVWLQIIFKSPGTKMEKL